MLVDTGASVTTVSSSFFSFLPSSPQLQQSNLLTIRTVSGEELPVQGQTTLTLTLGTVPYVLEALVIDNFNYPVVLGHDFLIQYGSVVDMQANTLVLSGNPPIPLHHSPSLLDTASETPESVTVHANATFILAPLSESVIPESREHTAFITYGGLYEFLVLLFGLTGAPSTYHQLMECVLRNLNYTICLIYLDDILVYSKTFEHHFCHLRQVFDRL